MPGAHVQPVVVGRQYDLELVADAVDGAHRLLDLAREELDAAEIDEVVGAPREGTHGAHVAPPAGAGAGVEGRVVADEESELRRAFGIERGADREAALVLGDALPRLGIHELPHLDVLGEMGEHLLAGG